MTVVSKICEPIAEICAPSWILRFEMRMLETLEGIQKTTTEMKHDLENMALFCLHHGRSKELIAN